MWSTAQRIGPGGSVGMPLGSRRGSSRVLPGPDQIVARRQVDAADIPQSSSLVLGAMVACAAVLLTGAADTKKKKEIPLKGDETIGDVANIFGSVMKVEGVGLVIGLDGTGSEPAPSLASRPPCATDWRKAFARPSPTTAPRRSFSSAKERHSSPAPTSANSARRRAAPACSTCRPRWRIRPSPPSPRLTAPPLAADWKWRSVAIIASPFRRRAAACRK